MATPRASRRPTAAQTRERAIAAVATALKAGRVLSATQAKKTRHPITVTVGPHGPGEYKIEWWGKTLKAPRAKVWPFASEVAEWFVANVGAARALYEAERP